MGIGDWGLGIGDWGLGPIPNPQSPIPSPQSPIPFFLIFNNFVIYTIQYIYIIKLLININKWKKWRKDLQKHYIL